MTRREAALLAAALSGALVLRCQVKPVVKAPVANPPVSGVPIPMGGVELAPRGSSGLRVTPTKEVPSATPTPSETEAPSPTPTVERDGRLRASRWSQAKPSGFSGQRSDSS